MFDIALRLLMQPFYAARAVQVAGGMPPAFPHLGPAWRLTRGHFWTLLGAYFVIWLAILIVSLIVMLPIIRPMFAAMAHPGDPMAAQRLAGLQAQQMALSFSPGGIALLLFSAIFGAVMLAALCGAPAVATAQLLDERSAIV